MFFAPEDLLKILLAVVVGGAIGIEREFRDKAAGFRTLIFICLGATLFTMFSLNLAGDKDPTRIASAIVSGVGFLGAGVILREGGRVIGLTTASTIWLTAALGMGIGGGQYPIISAAVVMTLLVLWVFPLFERRIDNIREEHIYEVTFYPADDKLNALEQIFRDSGLKIRSHRHTKCDGKLTCRWQATGSLEAHQRLTRQLLANQDVLEFRF